MDAQTVGACVLFCVSSALMGNAIAQLQHKRRIKKPVVNAVPKIIPMRVDCDLCEYSYDVAADMLIKERGGEGFPFYTLQVSIWDVAEGAKVAVVRGCDLSVRHSYGIDEWSLLDKSANRKVHSKGA